MSAVLGYNITVNDPTYAANSYDAVWALAPAFHEAQPLLSTSLDLYEYGDEKFAKVVGQSILNQTFAGMSVSLLSSYCTMLTLSHFNA